MANEYGEVPESLIRAVRHVESGDRPNLTSRKGARHEMQVMPAVARKPGHGVTPARDNSADEYNRVGEELLAAYWDKYRGDVPLVAAAYNAGPGAVAKHGGVPPYDETLNYIQKVTKKMQEEQGKGFSPEQIAEFEKRYAEEQEGGDKQFSPEQISEFEKRYAEEQAALEPEVPEGEEPSMLGEAWRRGVSGVKQAGQGVITGALSALGQDDLVQERMAEQEAIGKAEAEREAQYPELSSKTFQEIQDTAEKEGTWAAIKKIPNYIGQKVAESAPSTATPLGVGMAAGMVNPALGVAAGITASIVQEFGFMMDRQIEKEKLAGKLEPEKAAIAAIPAGALDAIADRFTLGMKLPSFLTREVKEGALDTVTKTFGGEVAKHVGKGIIAETPTEMGQTELERWQAGEPLSGPENWAEVKEAGISAGVAGGTAGTLGGTASYLQGAPMPEATGEEPIGDTAVEPPAPEPIAPVGMAPEATAPMPETGVPTPEATAPIPETGVPTPEAIPEATVEVPTPEAAVEVPTPEATAPIAEPVTPFDKQQAAELGLSQDEFKKIHTYKRVSPFKTDGEAEAAYKEHMDAQAKTVAELKKISSLPDLDSTVTIGGKDYTKQAYIKSQILHSNGLINTEQAEQNFEALKPKGKSEDVSYVPRDDTYAEHYKHVTDKGEASIDTAGRGLYITSNNPAQTHNIKAISAQDRGDKLLLETANKGQVSVDYVKGNVTFTGRDKSGSPVPLAHFNKVENNLSDLLNNKYGSKELNKTLYDSLIKPSEEGALHVIDKLGFGDSASKLFKAAETGLWRKHHPDYVDEYNKEMGGTTETPRYSVENTPEYKSSHRPPNIENGAPLHDVTKGGEIYPADIYSPKGLQYYGTGQDRADRESLNVIKNTKNKPDALVTMYRAVPKDSSINTINNGDWVTLSKTYAKEHGESALDDNYKIISKQVKANQLFTNGDSINEFGYWAEPTVQTTKVEEPSYSTAPTEATTGHTRASLSRTLSPEMKQLVASGKAVLHDTQATLPGKNHPANVKGMTTAEGVTHYVANKLTPSTIESVALHEVGVHAGMEKMLGKELWEDVKNQALNGQGKEFDKARAAVPASTPAHLKAEETLAYLVEHSPQLSLVRRIVAAIRNFMRSKMGANIRLSEADARQMAVASMRREATTAERTAREETAYTEKEKYERFYSALTKAIKGAPEKVFGSPNQIKLWLAGNSAKMDVKKDEIYWSGVNDWLDMQTSKVSKTDVLNYLNNGGVQVEDVMLREGEDTLTDKLFKDWLNTENAWVSYDPADDVYNAIIDGKYLGGVYNTEDEAMHRLKQEAMDDVEFTASTKHGGGSLVLPDGKDYRELVVNIPTTKSYNDHDTTHFGDVGEGKQIAWLRMNTRTDGKGRDTLFLEEVQSQRSQAGRKEGFIKPLSELEKTQAKIKFNRLKKLNTELFNKLKTFADRDPEWDVVHEERKGVLNEMSKLDDIISDNYEAGVPSAPFVTDSNNKATNAYISLLLKKAISHAIDNGMDSVSWTTGDQQSDRYDLSKQIKQIITERSDNVSSGLGRVILRAYNHNGSKVIYETLDSQDQLEQYIGKELAAKAIAEMDAGDGKADLRDVDLKVGGAWTQAMYGDENGLNAQGKPSMIMQSAMEIARKMGGRIDTLTLNTGNQAALIITPEMKAKVLNEGMPLFSVGANEKDKIKYSMKQTFEDELGSFKKQADSVSDKVLPVMLSPLSASGVQQVAGEEHLPGSKKVLQDTRKLAGLRDEMLTAFAKMRRDIFNPYIKKHRKELNKLGDTMSEATLLGVSPGEKGNIDAKIAEMEKERPKGYVQTIHRLNQLKEDYKKLSQPSKDVYQQLSKYYKDSLDKILEAYEHNIRTSGATQPTIDKQIAKFKEQMGALAIRGDYFPLMRFGKFGVAYKDGEVDPDTGEEIKKFTKFDTSAEAKKFLANSKINGYLVPDIKQFNKEMIGDNKSLQELYDEIDSSFEKSPDVAKDELKDFVFQMHLMSKSDASMAKRFIHRKGTPGYSNDVFRAFDHYTMNMARQLPRIKLGRNISNGLLEIRKKIQGVNPETKERYPEKSPIYYEAFSREIMDALHPKLTGPISNFATGAAFSYYLTSPASAILQLTSVALQGIPSIGKKHGYVLAHAAMGAATKMYLGSGIGPKTGWWNMERGAKLYSAEHGGYKKLIGDAKHADQFDIEKAYKSFLEEGIITSGIHAEAFSGKNRTTGAHENVMQKAANLMDLMSQPFAQMESASRQIVGTAAYIANMKSGMTHAQAVEAAIDSVYLDMGDFGSTGRATLTKSDIARVVWQFQQYGAKLLFSMAKSAVDLASKNGYKRKEAVKHLSGLMAMHWLFAGALGLPAAGMVGAFNDLLKDALSDDEWHNYKADLRAYLEAQGVDRAFINIVLDGPLSTLTGLKLSERLGAHELIPLIHESQVNDTLDVSAKDRLFEMFGGAAGSLAVNISEGVGLFTKGETERAIEKLVPNAIVKNALTATRYGTEGKINAKGEEVIAKEKFTPYDLFVQSLGFTPYKVFKGEESARSAKTDVSFIQDKRTELLAEFREALKEGDTKEALANIMAFNKKYPFAGISGKNIKQSVKTAGRARATSIYGMNFGKGEAAMREKYPGMVDDDSFDLEEDED